MSIKIEPGKSYRDSEGSRWDYVGQSTDELRPHLLQRAIGGRIATFTDEGWFLGSHIVSPLDLIAEWTEPEAQPTDKTETLRDKFAMAALTGMVIVDGPVEPTVVSASAYRYADAMMEARKK